MLGADLYHVLKEGETNADGFSGAKTEKLEEVRSKDMDSRT